MMTDIPRPVRHPTDGVDAADGHRQPPQSFTRRRLPCPRQGAAAARTGIGVLAVAAVVSVASAEGLDIVDLEAQPWYEASDRAVAREIASPRNSGAEKMSIADIRIPAGVSVKPHYHDWEEVYYVTAGHGMMHVDGVTEELHAGQAVVIPPNAWHHIANPTDADLRLIVVCAPPWHAEGLKYE